MFEKLKQIKWLNVILVLAISLGAVLVAQLFVLPNMVGWDINQIKHYEGSNDIALTYQYEYSKEHLYGHVISQRICDKDEACKLDLLISKGQDVSKLPKSEIQLYLSQLVDEKLILPSNIVYLDSNYSNDVKKDYALSYEPNPYEEKIELSFSLGQEVHVYEASMVAVGDILLHDTVYQDFQLTADTYDFTPLFEQITPYLEPSDFALVNQESNIGGASLGVSSYPNFNSPYEIVDTLVESGFNMFSRANNHTLDKGVDGVLSASKKYEEIQGIVHAGAASSQTQRDTIPVITKQGINLSLLSYTYGFNGHLLPEGMPYLGNLYDAKQVAIDVEKAKEVSDVVVVSMHWGDEYTSLPNDEQLKQAQYLADLGVDIIIGHHPHVLQPIDTLIGKNGNETLVVYSLGNFVSGQTDLEKNVGGIVKFDIKKMVIGQNEPIIEVSNIQFMPTYNYPKGRYSDYQLVPLIESSQKSYFETVETIMKTYDEDIEVVNYITYN